jgi:predicted XRE-type DNA-binding protein
MIDEMVVHDSTGNIFADMEMRDAEERLARAELARAIRKILESRGLKQAEAVGLLRIPQTDMSDLVRGKLARFSMERLQRILNAL